MNDKFELSDSDFQLEFLIEEEKKEEVVKEVYKILIADDDIEVHKATKLVLKNFTFENRRIEFIDTYNSKDTMDIMANTSDIAVILLDVVMDESNSGLKLVNYIRSTLNNKFVRIILRTGQPGNAPEEVVIVNYDINDYLLKTEITVQRLFTSLYQSLRSYRDITLLEKNRKGMENIVKSSSELFSKENIQEFFNCILVELLSFKRENSSLCFRQAEDDTGLVYIGDGFSEKVIAATGSFDKYLGKDIHEVTELTEIFNYINKIEKSSGNEYVYIYGGYLIWVRNKNNNTIFIFINSDIQNHDIDLIKVFLANYSLALDSFFANQQVLSTQFEIINTLGDAIEVRSHETGNHVKRVSSISSFLAEKLNLPISKCTMIKMASTMHDVGKIGINDNVLMKAGKLTEEEFNLIKKHTEIGHSIFKNSELDILKTASIICLYHHERFNGLGYPNGLKGEEIPIEARIVAIADVFDALTHKRCYKDAWDMNKTLDYLISEKGQHFDPDIVDIFTQNIHGILDICNEFPD